MHGLSNRQHKARRLMSRAFEDLERETLPEGVTLERKNGNTDWIFRFSGHTAHFYPTRGRLLIDGEERIYGIPEKKVLSTIQEMLEGEA